MIGCLLTCVRMQPIIVLYLESETVHKLYNLEARGSFATILDSRCGLIDWLAFLFNEETGAC